MTATARAGASGLVLRPTPRAKGAQGRRELRERRGGGSFMRFPPPRLISLSRYWPTLPTAARGGGEKFSHSRAALFDGAPSFAVRHERTGLQTNKGRRSADKRIGRYRMPAARRCRLSLRSSGAAPTLTLPRLRRREWEGAARLSALYRGSRQRPRGLGSVRSRASWSRTTDPRPGQPAPGGPASWQAGRVSEPPANEVTSLLPGTAPARINRPSPVDVPWPSRM